MLDDLINGVKNAVKAVDDDPCSVWIDSGSYALNALVSGSIYGGYPGDRLSMLAGNSQVGKTFMCLHAIKNFLIDNPKGYVVFFDSENAIDRTNFESFDIDTKRVARVEIYSIGEAKNKLSTILNNYFEKADTDKKREDSPLLMVVDSIGMLPSAKEVRDAQDQKEVVDMTRAKDMGSFMRILTSKAAANRVPVILTNHVYSEIGMFPKDVLKGGKTVEYSCSTIPMLTKAMDKDGNDQVGILVKAKMFKSRFTKPGKIIQFAVNFDTGLNRYYGLLDMAIECGAFSKESTRVVLPCGKKLFAKVINANGEEYYTKDVLEQIEAYVQKTYKFGNAKPETLEHALGEKNETLED